MLHVRLAETLDTTRNRTGDRFTAIDNLKRFAAGEPLREVVDRARGY